MLIKQLFNTPADIIPNEKEQTLTICLASLSAARYNQAISKLCEILNDTETLFPGTNLKLIYKIYSGCLRQARSSEIQR